jgi:DNA processing protein
MLTQRSSIMPEQVAQTLEQKGIKLVASEEEHYPFLLAELSDSPPLLYYKGQLQPRAETIAIVGSRKATAYGKAAAVQLGRETVSEGLVVVSGMARGIDAAAHKGALEGHGTTWAFLGCGVDVVYPPEYQHLAQAILEQGALLSEYTPGTPPEANNFPVRNRLISGAARGVVVVEAAEKSGALITVDFALEQGREVFAVPGPIFSPLSRGTHDLIKQGATLITGVRDILGEVRRQAPSLFPAFSEGNDTPAQQKIIALLSDVPAHIDRIIDESALAPEDIALTLMELELQNRIIQLPGQHFVLAR